LQATKRKREFDEFVISKKFKRCDVAMRLSQIQHASALGCSIIPDCVVDSQMYVVVSCVYQEE